MKNLSSVMLLTVIFVLANSNFVHADGSSAMKPKMPATSVYAASDDGQAQAPLNDEGYSKDDTEYYSSENDNEEIVPEETNEVIDDEMPKDETVDNLSAEPALPPDTGYPN